MDQRLVHVYPDPARIGGVYRTALGLPVDPVAFLELLAERPAATAAARRAWVEGLHRQARDLAAYTPVPMTDGVNFGAVVQAISRRAEPDAVIVTDAGNFSSWVHRHWPWQPANLILGTVGGAMGLGVPGAVAAALRLPERQVLTFVGDGGMLMTGGELATAMQQGARLKVFLSNNRSYGTIRLHQERDFPHRVTATDLANPDFAQLARAFGATAMVIERYEDIEDVVARALVAEESVIVDVRASLEAISAYTTIERLHAGVANRKPTQ